MCFQGFEADVYNATDMPSRPALFDLVLSPQDCAAIVVEDYYERFFRRSGEIDMQMVGGQPAAP